MFYATTEKKTEGRGTEEALEGFETRSKKEQGTRREKNKRRQRDFKRAPSRPRAHSSVVLIHQVLVPEVRTKCPLRLGRLSARGERAQKSAIAQTRFRLASLPLLAALFSLSFSLAFLFLLLSRRNLSLSPAFGTTYRDARDPVCEQRAHGWLYEAPEGGGGVGKGGG